MSIELSIYSEPNEKGESISGSWGNIVIEGDVLMKLDSEGCVFFNQINPEGDYYFHDPAVLKVAVDEVIEKVTNYDEDMLMLSKEIFVDNMKQIAQVLLSAQEKGIQVTMGLH